MEFWKNVKMYDLTQNLNAAMADLRAAANQVF
jgi:hypothetical protein